MYSWIYRRWEYCC